MGGTAALDVLLARPARVSALVMVCSDPSGYMPEGALPPLLLELIAASKAGDAEAMADVAVKLWGVGENRDPEAVDAKFKARMREMSLIGFRNQLAGLGEEQPPAAPALGRLGDVRVPTLIIDGAEDNPTTHTAGEIMAAQIAGAKRIVMPGTAHLPSLERPAEFNRILSEFLNPVLQA
jgi:pimeloyl-ACP methyl ester carboxylesterase